MRVENLPEWPHPKGPWAPARLFGKSASAGLESAPKRSNIARQTPAEVYRPDYGPPGISRLHQFFGTTNEFIY